MRSGKVFQNGIKLSATIFSERKSEGALISGQIAIVEILHSTKSCGSSFFQALQDVKSLKIAILYSRCSESASNTTLNVSNFETFEARNQLFLMNEPPIEFVPAIFESSFALWQKK